MASLAALADELLVQICSYLEDTTSTKALALTCRRTTNCALERHRSLCIDLSSNHAQVLHDVLHKLSSSLVNDVDPPEIDIYRTGYALTDKALEHALTYKAIRVSFSDRYPDRELVYACNVLAAAIDPRTRYTDRAFWPTYTMDYDDLCHLVGLVLRLARGTTALELKGSLYWMYDMTWSGWISRMIEFDTLCSLRKLRLTESYSNPVPRVSLRRLLELPFLSTFEFADMQVADDMARIFSEPTSVTCLRLQNCHIRPSALAMVIGGCPNLESFEYSMGVDYWRTDTTYDVALLVSELRSFVKNTLRHVTLRTLGVRLNDRCHYLDDISQFKHLESLAINEDHLHLNHRYIPLPLCQERRQQQKHLFSDSDSIGIRGSQILLSLPNSLRSLHLVVWSEAVLSQTLPKILRRMEVDENLPNLRDIQITVELSGACSQREFDRNAPKLLDQAANIDGLHLKLEAVQRGSPFTLSKRPWKHFTTSKTVDSLRQFLPDW